MSQVAITAAWPSFIDISSAGGKPPLQNRQKSAVAIAGTLRLALSLCA
jgi:hypothetical protein